MKKGNSSSEIAITGIGIVSSLGSGYKDFTDAVMESRNGIKEVSLFETSQYKSNLAGEVDAFEPELFLPKKGQRHMDRSTKFISAAAVMALNDANFQINDSNKQHTGVVVGTTYGNLKSISDFDIESLKGESPLWVNPMDFPKTTINAPASNVSIITGAMGYNTTIVGGFTSTMEAIAHGVDLLQSNRLDTVLVGSVEDLNEQSFLHHSVLESFGGNEHSVPFDTSSNGYVIGEGAVVFVLERVDDVLKQNRHIRARIKSINQGFDGSPNYSYFSIPGSDSCAEIFSKALEKAGLIPADVNIISASANGWIPFDRSEAEALSKVFSGYSPLVTAVKSMIGEAASAGGAFGIALAVAAIERQQVPCILNLNEPSVPLNYVLGKTREISIENALITSIDPCGNCMGMIISGK